MESGGLELSCQCRYFLLLLGDVETGGIDCSVKRLHDVGVAGTSRRLVKPRCRHRRWRIKSVLWSRGRGRSEPGPEEMDIEWSGMVLAREGEDDGCACCKAVSSGDLAAKQQSRTGRASDGDFELLSGRGGHAAAVHCKEQVVPENTAVALGRTALHEVEHPQLLVKDDADANVLRS